MPDCLHGSMERRILVECKGRQRLSFRGASVNVFAIRHGETAWSLSGQHTGTTDIALTENGRRLAEKLRPMLAKQNFALVLCSPMQRARETQIHETAPGWLLFRDGCPGGETPQQVGGRADRVIAGARGRWRCRAIRTWAHPAGASSALDWVVCEFRSALSAGYRHLVRPGLLPRRARREGLERTPHRLAPMIGREAPTGRRKQ